MKTVDTLWLRGQAAQRDIILINHYAATFLGTALVQGLLLGWQAPSRMWAAMARAGSAPNAVVTPDLGQMDGPSPHLLDGPRDGLADDLTIIAGLGPRLAQSLNEFGIYHFDQIATLDDTGIDWINTHQRGFRRQCLRHDFVGQARARIGGLAKN